MLAAEYGRRRSQPGVCEVSSWFRAQRLQCGQACARVAVAEAGVVAALQNLEEDRPGDRLGMALQQAAGLNRNRSAWLRS